MKKQTLLGKFLIWRAKNMSQAQYMMLLSAVVGFAVGVSAMVIKNSVHFIQYLLTNPFAKEYENYLFFAYPLVGILLVVLFVRYGLKQKINHGIPGVLYAISQKGGRIKRHNMFSSVVTSALTVGFGGSVGLEGPTVATGAAIGSNMGQMLHLNTRQVTLMLACACAGALSAIFKAPIAAIVFALEVIMLDLTMSALVPLLIASLCAALTSYMFLGQERIYAFHLTSSFSLRDIPYFVILGIIAGVVSVYYTRVYRVIGRYFDQVENQYVRWITGGLILGVLIFFLPPLYGEGYKTINNILHGDIGELFNNSLFYDLRENIWIVIGFVFMISILKVIATSVTFGSGGIGGIFAPTLFMGATGGFLFAFILNSFILHTPVNASNFALVGMAGLISGVLHAPLTAIFLIAEITGGYALFVPLMIAATIAYAVTRYFEQNSVYTMELAKRKHLITHNKDKAALTRMHVGDYLETDFSIISPDANLGDLVKVITRSKRNLFPVVDQKGMLHGIVRLDDIREIMFDQELYDETRVIDLMVIPEISFNPNENMHDIANKIQVSGTFNIPVIDEGLYLGFVSKANIFSAYRTVLKSYSAD